jgi:hypothetical protein
MPFDAMACVIPPCVKRLADVPRSLEKSWYKNMRREHAHRWLAKDIGTYHKRLAALLTLVVVGSICLPLLVTAKSSFGKAKDVCYERQLAKLSDFYEGEEWEFDDYANRHLFPLHLFNSIATIVSLLSFLAWLFHSPHANEGSEEMDRQCNAPPPPS